MLASGWSDGSLIYEINTWVWLAELRARRGSAIDLGSVPDEEWDALVDLGFDAVWLMGVWERSVLSRQIALADTPLVAAVRQVLPDLAEADFVGSPYSVKRYRVDAWLGGDIGLARARNELARRGIRLILDFVPNHIAPDNPWVAANPEYLVAGSHDDLLRDPDGFSQLGESIFARGKDPNFPAWKDVVQLNAFDPGLRAAATEVAQTIADRCDGLRCDLPMLVINQVFERTWGARVGRPPDQEYWTELIASVKKQHPATLFLAEAYWDLESELLRQGFDACYDKRLYDRLAYGSADSVRQHFGADRSFQSHLLRFAENHDEPRAASLFAGARGRAIATAAYTLPGLKLVHDGQLDGRKSHVPVFLGRRPDEVPDPNVREFYEGLLRAIKAQRIGAGEWRQVGLSGWPDNQNWRNLVGWTWLSDRTTLVLVNLSPFRSQALVWLDWPSLRGQRWRLEDPLAGRVYERDGDQLADSGLFVELAGWETHFFSASPTESSQLSDRTVELSAGASDAS